MIGVWYGLVQKALDGLLKRLSGIMRSGINMGPVLPWNLQGCTCWFESVRTSEFGVNPTPWFPLVTAEQT